MAVPAEQQNYRELFGKNISSWMRLCNFSQQTIHNMALCLKTEGPWNSQVSLLQRGKHDPKCQFWVSWGVLNKAIESGDKSLFAPKHLYDQDGKPLIKNPESASRQLIDRLENAMPFLTEHDKPATASDFYSMFIGELKASSIYEQPISLSDIDAERLTQSYREKFRQIALDQMISPKEVWQNLEPRCRDLGMDSSQVKHFQEILVGMADYTGDELTALTISAADKPIPSKVLDA